MPKMDFLLPTDETVPLIYGAIYPAFGTPYLQGVRSGRVKEDSSQAQEYRGMENTFASRLAEEVAKEAPQGSKVISPPSSRDDAKTYREAILKKTKGKLLTGTFSRKGEKKASDGGTVREMIQEFKYTPGGDETDIKSIIVVDESIATGKTIAAVLEHLRNAGVPRGCYITIAVWGLLQQ